MPISIITRAYKSSELEKLVNNLNSVSEIEQEVVAVCNVKNYDIKNAKLIIEETNRFEARITGIKNAKYDRVLFLDSDQIPEYGLLKELEKKQDNMVIIPEKSINNNFTAKCLDDWRYRNEKLAKTLITPYIPVVPRFYRKQHLISAINKLSTSTYKIIDHEDSILYYYVLQVTQNVNFSEKHIFNCDPRFINLMRKAFLYGRNKKYTKNLDIPEEISLLLYKLNKHSLNLKALGFGKGYIIQIMRGIFYQLGGIFSDLKSQ